MDASLSIERLDSRIAMAADLSVELAELTSETGHAFELRATLEGDTAEFVRIRQMAGELDNLAWEQRSPFPRIIDLSTSLEGLQDRTPWAKDGLYGYAIFGEQLDFAGGLLATGDIDGDDIDDLIISIANQADETGSTLRMEIIRGTTDERADSDLSELVQTDGLLSFVAERWDVGDFNGDAIIDVVTSSVDDGVNPARSDVYFGRKNIASFPNPEAFDGSNGFSVFNTLSTERDRHVTRNTGDVNGDGIDDLFLEVFNPLEDGEEFAFVYGSKSPSRSVDTIDLDGNDGSIWFHTGSMRGRSSPVGDINGDERSDYFFHGVGKILLGTENSDIAVSLDDLPSSRTVEIEGWVSPIGDLDGDGFDDILRLAEEPQIRFGAASGITSTSSKSVSLHRDISLGDSTAFADTVTTGDINGDGLADAVIVDRNSGGFGFSDGEGPGSVYVLFGTNSGYPSEITLRDYLDGENGFIVKGFSAFGDFGAHVSVGDVNGDEIDDLVIPDALSATPNGESAGAVHVLFGRKTKDAETGTLDSTIRMVPGEEVRYRIEGTLPAGSVFSAVTYSAELLGGSVDSNPGNNSARVFVGDSVSASDIDRDGAVAFPDFLILASNFGKSIAARDEGDIDGNGRIDFTDFLILQQEFGKPSGVANAQ